jgi:hypothetical protein
LFLLGRFVVEATSLDDLLVDVELVLSTCMHRLFDALLSDEPEDAHDLGLADTMSTILRLQVGMRVPIAIVAARVVNHAGHLV